MVGGTEECEWKGRCVSKFVEPIDLDIFIVTGPSPGARTGASSDRPRTAPPLSSPLLPIDRPDRLLVPAVTITMLRSFLLFTVLWTLAAAAGTTPEGLQWLLQKKTEAGVVETESGLLYKEIRPGTGKTPTIDSPCSCHYSGTLIDGTEFDSSYKRGEPLTFAPNQVIKGWTEAMQMMKEGAKWELYIKSELAYGDRGAGGLIPPGAVLIFELELLKVKGDHADL